MSSDFIQQPFNAIRDAINRDGNDPAHQESALRAELMGAIFGASFGMFSKAWGLEDNKNTSVLQDPLLKPLGQFMDNQTRKVLHDMQLNAGLLNNPYATPPARPPRRWIP